MGSGEAGTAHGGRAAGLPSDASGRTSHSAAPPAGSSGLWKLLAGLLVLAALLLVAREAGDVVPRLLETVRGLGPWAALAFVGIYAVATVAWVPGSLLTLAAGAIFGLLHGTLYALAGATLGAALAFLVARYLARGAIEQRLGDHGRLAAVDAALGRKGGRIVLLLRLSPVFPFNALNYALGLTQVRFRDYLLTSAIGMAPGTFMYVYAGYAAGEVALGAGGAAPRPPGYYALLAVGLAATVAVTVLVTRLARRALRRGSNIDGAVG